MAAVIVALAVLVRLAYDRADACACGSADDGSFEAASEDGSEDGSAACADESSFAGPDASLIAAVIVVVSVVVVVLSAVTAVADSVVKVGIVVPVISILGAGAYGEKTCGQHERGDEYSFAYLHHLGLDAGWVVCGNGAFRIFSTSAVSPPMYTNPCKVFIRCGLDLDLIRKLLILLDSDLVF